MKITVIAPKPRNPFASLARTRRAGSHRVGTGHLRQQARRALKRELDHMQHSP